VWKVSHNEKLCSSAGAATNSFSSINWRVISSMVEFPGKTLPGAEMRNRSLLCSVAAGVGAACLFMTAPSAAGELQLDQGLALHLPLTADLKDHSPAALPVEVVGNVRVEKEGAYFGGRMDWLEAPHIALNGRPFSIALWIRETSEERTVGLVEQFDRNQPRRHLHLMLRGNRQPYFGIYDRNLASPLIVPRDQEWVHLVFQYTGAELQIWINGHLIIARKSPPYEGETGVTAIGKIPRWSNVPGKDLVGYMRDFRIYQRALSVEEIGVLAAINVPGADAAVKLVQVDIPTLSQETVASRTAMSQVLSADPALPFLEISARQITINGQGGQIYTLQTSGDLNQWSPLMRLTNQTGRVVYDYQADQPAQFFRVRVDGFTQ
jgi:hypothetical protein